MSSTATTTAAIPNQALVVLQHLLNLLVDEPRAIMIVPFVDPYRRHTRFVVTCAIADVGKLIGKGGANVQAIRRLLAAASAKQDWRYELEIDDGRQADRRARQRRRPYPAELEGKL